MTKILLVEDNPLNQDMLSRRLSRQGYEVVIAIDGAAGLAMTKTKRPDLILMDMNIPVIDGWEATRRLKADSQTQAIPIIALTAHAMAGDREKAIAAGCNEYATKPVEFKQLLKTIRAFIPQKPVTPTPSAAATRSASPPGVAPVAASQRNSVVELPFTLLVVNDNDTSREVLSAHLQRKGYTTVSASSRITALDILQQFSIDLVLLDITLPETEAIETLQHIRQTSPKTALPVIMISVKDADDDVIRAFEMGANDYVTKPINLAIIMARIQSQLETRQSPPPAENKQTVQPPQPIEIPTEMPTEMPTETPPEASVEMSVETTVAEPAISIQDQLVTIVQEPKQISADHPVEKGIPTFVPSQEHLLPIKDTLLVGGNPHPDTQSQNNGVVSPLPSQQSRDRYPLEQPFSLTHFSQMNLVETSEVPGKPSHFIETFSPSLKDNSLLEDLRTFASIEYAHLEIISQNSKILGVLNFWEQDKSFHWSQVYTEGHLFSQELKPHNPLPPQVVLDVVKEILEILLPFHMRQVIHSAIQPDHLWRCQQDGQLKLLNLGLSRRLLTHLSQRVPQYRLGLNQQHDYMPIEQRIGQTVLSSDIYAVGVIALQMLTGEVPSVLTSTLLASNSPWHQLTSTTPEMTQLLSKMLPQNHRERYASALAALKDINALRAHL
ncbi:MAG: response regulator [Cyanobacteria bacterium P01_F01_bin.4]